MLQLNGCYVKASYSDSTIIIQKFNSSKPQGNKLRFSNNFNNVLVEVSFLEQKINLI